MNQKKLSNVFVWGFLFLYLLVACISFCHAVQFFNIGNVQWMSITLAFAFELGLALSLASILLSEKNKKQTLPWVLMVVLCIVQVIGNVYSTFKYISLSEEDYYQYLAKPLLFFIEDVDENTIQVIVSWIMGAILPIIALFMTDMVANNIKNSEDENKEDKEKNLNNNVDNKKDILLPTKEYINNTDYFIPERDNENLHVEEKKEKEAETEPLVEKENISDYIEVLSNSNEEHNSKTEKIEETKKEIEEPNQNIASPTLVDKIPEVSVAPVQVEKNIVVNPAVPSTIPAAKPIIKKVEEPIARHILETPKENMGKKILGTIFDLGNNKKKTHLAEDTYFKDPEI